MKITINEQIRSAKEWQFYVTDLSESRQNLKFMESQARDKKAKQRNYRKNIRAKEKLCVEKAKSKEILKEFIIRNGYTFKQWTECVDELLDKGIPNGCFQDYKLLTLVIEWLFYGLGENYESCN